METKDMVIVGLVVLLVLTVAFSTNIATTGNVPKRVCTDTDGNNPFTKGTVTGTDAAGNVIEPKTDYCSEKTIGNVNKVYYVKEYYCDEQNSYNGWAVDFAICENGCVDGACI